MGSTSSSSNSSSSSEQISLSTKVKEPLNGLISSLSVVKRATFGIQNEYIHHDGLIIEIQGKFYICEWTWESKVNFCVPNKVNIEKNKLDDGLYIWKLRNLANQKPMRLDDLRILVEKSQSEGTNSEYSLGSNNCQHFIERLEKILVKYQNYREELKFEIEIKNQKNLKIKNCYKRTTNIQAFFKGSPDQHVGVLFETKEGKYGVFEWMEDSQIHFYYVFQTEFKDNSYYDGEQNWQIENINDNEVTLDDIRGIVEKEIQGTNAIYSIFTNNSLHFYQRIHQKIKNFEGKQYKTKMNPGQDKSKIKKIYIGTRQNEVKETEKVIIVETEEGKYATFQWRADSEVHYYYFDKPKKQGNTFDDGQYNWEIKSINELVIRWNHIIKTVKKAHKGNFSKTSNNCQHFYERIQTEFENLKEYKYTTVFDPKEDTAKIIEINKVTRKDNKFLVQGIVVKTKEGKYATFEWRADSQVHYYYFNEPQKVGEEFDDGMDIWKIENLKIQEEKKWRDIRVAVMDQKYDEAKFHPTNNNNTHFCDAMMKELKNQQ